MSCTHLDTVHVTQPTATGCADCLRIGGWWVHLRMCLQCGHVACCDNSPNRHASGHGAAARHPILRSVEPGEDWAWCLEDETFFETVPPLAG